MILQSNLKRQEIGREKAIYKEQIIGFLRKALAGLAVAELRQSLIKHTGTGLL